MRQRDPCRGCARRWALCHLRCEEHAGAAAEKKPAAGKRPAGMLWQRLGGLVLLAGAVALPAVEGDATASVVLAPLGAWLLCSKRRLLR